MLTTVLIIDKRKELPAKYKKCLEDTETQVIITRNLKDAFFSMQDLEPDMIIVSDSIEEKLPDPERTRAIGGYSSPNIRQNPAFSYAPAAAAAASQEQNKAPLSSKSRQSSLSSSIIIPRRRNSGRVTTLPKFPAPVLRENPNHIRQHGTPPMTPA